MKHAEGCACGAYVNVEDAEPETAYAAIHDWRDRHQQRCRIDQQRVISGTAQGQYEIGFTNYAEDKA